MKKITSKKSYYKHFPEDLRKEALKNAHDIRKFEIELYWKRSTYFWTLIGAAFVAYFAVEKDSQDSAFMVACLGLIFSIAWYLVSRGSKYWQENWEMHLDLLEDKLTGPLHKIVFTHPDSRFWRLTSSLAISPSKLNQMTALIMSAVWFLIILKYMIFLFTPIDVRNSKMLQAVFALSMLGSLALIFWSHTEGDDKEINATLREVRDGKPE